jgi:hypothetical protein
MSGADTEPDGDHASGDPTPARSPEPPGGALIGPAFGVLLGFLVLKLLPTGTAVWLRLAAAVAVIAVVTYATIEITRWRGRRRER